MRLLIVDDDPVFREELAELLASDGHETTAVPSVAAATQKLEQAEFDLVFTDLKMPRHGGLELLAEIRRRWPRTLAVMITGFATVDTAVEAMKLGAFDYVRKPFRLEQLQKVLALAGEETRFEEATPSSRGLEALVRRWTERDGLDVLWVSDRRHRDQPRITLLPAAGLDAARCRDAVESFLGGKTRAAVAIEGIDRIAGAARREDLLEFVTVLRRRTAGVGPLVVTYDPGRLPADDAEDLRAALVGFRTRSTLEAVSNPIRRAVLRRSQVGPITFSQAMEAAGLDDSPKLSFHLRRLVDEGLVRHADDRYRITPQGEESLRLLSEWDSTVASDPASSAAIAQTRS